MAIRKHDVIIIFAKSFFFIHKIKLIRKFTF